MKVHVIPDGDATEELVGSIRAMLAEAFNGRFSSDDWDHTLGGWRVIAADDDVLGHAALVERTLEVGGRPFRTGYVEAVATTPSQQGRGIGSLVMRRINRLLRTTFELGALLTSRHTFYEQLGWERWQGPAFVRYGERLVRTAEEDDGIMVFRFGPSADVGLSSAILCDPRSGDDW